jgi:hypothetical protein
MGAAYVPMDIDQGEDYTSDIIYTDDMDSPYNVIAPCRLDIKSQTGATQLSLTTPDTALPDGEIPEITLSSEEGLIQLHIEDTVTAAMVPGTYQYDLFVTVDDGGVYAGSQTLRLIQGECTVYSRTTVM